MFIIDNFNVYESDSVKYLGITLQGNLSWDLDIRELKSKIVPAIGILHKIRNKFNGNTKHLLYHSLIFCQQNYMASKAL